MEENKTVEETLKTDEQEIQTDSVTEAEKIDEQEEMEKGENPNTTEASEEEKVEDEKDTSNEYLERLQRLMAEFDNYRKRSEKEKINTYDVAVSDVITELLPLVDNFERALKQGNQEDSFYKGVEMIYKQLMGMFEKFKIETIQAEGEVFDPNLHNAVFHVEDENVGENVIVEELQKGYLYKERVLRHSLVKVAN